VFTGITDPIAIIGGTTVAFTADSAVAALVDLNDRVM
jgi:hypothetical protein